MTMTDRCECTACGGCAELATTTDSMVGLCDTCADYTVDADGTVYCARCDEVEVVIESCGAGGQLRSYARMVPPDMPDTDPDGVWGCVWEEGFEGDKDIVVSRHSTRDAAEQAVAAHDWPPPGDHTQYICGYVVRRLLATGGCEQDVT